MLFDSEENKECFRLRKTANGRVNGPTQVRSQVFQTLKVYHLRTKRGITK